MTRHIFTTILLAAAIGASAQNIDKYGVSGIDIHKRQTDVSVSFTFDPQKYHLGLTREMTLVPCIISAEGSDTIRLAPIRIGGKNAWYYDRRNPQPGQSPMLRAGKDAPMLYEASVPLEQWIDYSRFEIVAQASGCCPGTLPQAPEITPVANIDWRPRTYVADFEFVTPEVDTVKQYDISGRAYVNFKVNRTEIEPNYMRNPEELRKILNTINTVRDNKDATVRNIKLTGYASPEGPYANNVRLARERTESLRDYVSRQYPFPASTYTTSSVPEDWAGLRDSVAASFLPQRQAILNFIDTYPGPIEKKNDALRAQFPKEYAYLLANIYPWLRHTDYVITYNIRRYTDVEEIREVMRTAPGNLSLNELFIGARSYPVGSDEYNNAFELAAALFSSSEVANLNAANSLMSRGDYIKAAQYLDKAGASPEAVYARGVLAALQNDYVRAEAYFASAAQAGFQPAVAARQQAAMAQTAPDGVTFLEITE